MKRKSQLKDAKAAKEERANSSKRVREVMTSQSLKENSTSKVNSISTLMTSSVSSTVSSTVNSVENANQNAQNSTVNSTSTLMMTNSAENLTSTSVTTKAS